jgi:AcrR family transcriptional regulator
VPSPGGKRRSPGAGRELVIRSARELFARQGYGGTSLRDIAERAGVNESVIYRNLGTKEQIFQAAVLDPFHGFVASFVGRWREIPERRSNEEMVRSFIYELHDLMSQHRDSIMALVSVSGMEDVRGQITARVQFNDELDALAAQTEADGQGRGLAGDLGMGVRMSVGLVMSLVLLDDWLLPMGDRRPDRTELLDQVSRFVVGGLEYGGATAARD